MLMHLHEHDSSMQWGTEELTKLVLLECSTEKRVVYLIGKIKKNLLLGFKFIYNYIIKLGIQTLIFITLAIIALLLMNIYIKPININFIINSIKTLNLYWKAILLMSLTSLIFVFIAGRKTIKNFIYKLFNIHTLIYLTELLSHLY